MVQIIRKDCVPYYIDIVSLIDDSSHGEQLAPMKLITFCSRMVQNKGSKCFGLCRGQAPSERTLFDNKHHELKNFDVYRHNRILDINPDNTVIARK